MKELGLPPELYHELKKSGSKNYSPDRVFHVLVKEPFNVPFSELGCLTPVVVRRVYFRKDEEEKGSLPMPDVQHFQRCEASGIPREEAERLWAEQLVADPQLAALYGQSS